MKFKTKLLNWTLGLGFLLLPACQTQDSKTLLKACRQCNPEQAQAFLSSMGSSMRGRLMEEALHQALKHDCTEVVKLLLPAGADAYLDRMLGGMLPLEWAAQSEGPEMAKALIAAGANVTGLGAKSALIYAARMGHLETVKLLIESGVDVKDRDGDIAIADVADRIADCTKPYPEIMLALIAAGADVNTRILISKKQVPLIVMVSREDSEAFDEVLRAMIKAGAKVNDVEGFTPPLLSAARQGSEARMRMLLEAGANVKVADVNDMTPLMYVSSMGKVDLMRAMIQAGADVNAQNKEGKTALMMAVHHGDAEAVRILLEAGADVNAKDKEGRTALQDPKIEVQNLLQSAVAR